MSAPIIEHLAWGVIKVNHGGNRETFKDAKLSPNGAKIWNWKETGTNHHPGIQIADVEEFVGTERPVETVILSRGMQLVLEVMPETVEYLKSHNVNCLIEQTEKAAQLYNELVSKGVKVAGVFHSTC